MAASEWHYRSFTMNTSLFEIVVNMVNVLIDLEHCDASTTCCPVNVNGVYLSEEDRFLSEIIESLPDFAVVQMTEITLANEHVSSPKHLQLSELVIRGDARVTCFSTVIATHEADWIKAPKVLEV
ncbi:unnamed protein product [Angiostrongylus costaricensis]|uniref:Acyl-CoA thioesterase n=1 Tax=Angiostrongylus costaricensis TaxID=334426 RepID=A0A0R3PUQ8_ANGCS|nr:unnamed protein product [Angiostrongylus costaricensis]